MQKSVHLENFPNFGNSRIDNNLIDEMDKIRVICSVASSIRKDVNIKLRMPLFSISIYGDDLHFIEKYRQIILDETNIKKLNIYDNIENIGRKVVKLDLKSLGPKVGKNIQKIIQAQKNNNYKFIDDNTIEIEEIKIKSPDFKIDFETNDVIGVKFCDIAKCAIKLDLNITQELKNEGIMRDFIRIIQQNRKNSKYNVMDKINLIIGVDNQEIHDVIEVFKEYIMSQCLIKDFEIIKKSDKIFNEKGFKECEIDDKIFLMIMEK